MRYGTSRQENRLDDYPFWGPIKETVLGECLGAPESLEPRKSGYRVRLSLRVADEELMLRKPVIFWKSGKCSRLYTGKHGGEIRGAWQKEWIYAIKGENLLNAISWPIGPEDNRRQRTPFAGQVLWTRKEGGGPCPLYEETECLVWVTLRIYHIMKNGKEWLERDVYVYLYQEPDIGFGQLCERFMAQK